MLVEDHRKVCGRSLGKKDLKIETVLGSQKGPFRRRMQQMKSNLLAEGLRIARGRDRDRFAGHFS